MSFRLPTLALINLVLRNGWTLFFLFHFNSAQELVQQGATPSIPATTNTMNDMTSYGGDVLVVANDAELFVYYENYLLTTSPTSSYSQGSPLYVQGCPTVVPAPTECQIGAVAAGQSLKTFDVLLGGLPDSDGAAGSVVVWKDTRVDWSQQQVLVARDATASDNFGYDVALDMNNPHVALIGAPNSDDVGSSSGSAYMFASSPTGKYWTEGQRLVGSTESTNCQFGTEVQVMGRQAIVSAPGCCKVFLFEQEKPKPVPPPPPAGCGSDDDNVSSSSFSSLKDHFQSSLFHPFEDIHQTRTLQWSEQQVLDYSSTGWCTSNTGGQFMSMSYDSGRLVLGFPYYDTGYSDPGMVVSLNLETFRGDCDSNIFPTMLSFEELFDMKEAALRDWESMYSGRHHDDSKCTHPPKPTPQCEVSRWSVQQYIIPGLIECSYFGANVALCEDLLFVQAPNYDTNGADDNPNNCNSDLQSGTWGNTNYYDGSVMVYEMQSNGQWALIQTLLPTANTNQNYGNPLTCAGANAYFGQTEVTKTPSPRPQPDPTPVLPYIYITATGATTTYQYIQDDTWDCVIIMLGDHFGDGWNGADLVISGPGGDQQRYTDSCDSISNPYYIRWCPVDNNECGEVTMEIPGAANIPFHPEIYWGVYLEDSGTWVYGDHATKLTFDWDCDNHDLSLVEGKHVLTNTSCDCDCQTTRPTPKPTPQEKPQPRPDANVHPPTTSPTQSPTVSPTLSPTTSRRALLSSSSPHNDTVNGPHDPTHPLTGRQLKGGDDSTHRPTISPAPTLALQPYTSDHWEWLTMTTSGNAWCTGNDNTMRGTKYYIYDKSGTHLLQTGSACAVTNVQCWMVLPPNGDYILRIGGALDVDRGSFGATFCGYPLISPSHFEFSITSDQQCIPEEYYTRPEYCTTQLHVKALVSGVLLIKDVFLATEGLSKLDQYIFQKAFDSLFGNIGITSTVRSEDSSDGLLISFTIGVPVVYYGYENTLFNGPHLTYLKAHDDLLNSFHADLFSALLDNQIHAALNQQQQHGGGGMDDYGQCHLKSHGAISLLALKEDGWDNEMPYGDTIEPITFYPHADDDDKMKAESTFLSSFQTGIPTFLLVVVVGGTILFFVYSKEKFVRSSSRSSSSSLEESSSHSSSSSHPSNGYFKYIYDFAKVRSMPSASSSRGSKSVDYEVIRTPSDDVEAHLERSVKKGQSSSSDKNKSKSSGGSGSGKGTRSTSHKSSSTSNTSSSSSSAALFLSSKSRFVPSSTVTATATAGSRHKKQKEDLLEFDEDDNEEDDNEEDDDDDEEEDVEIDDDVLSLIMQASHQQSSKQKQRQQTKSESRKKPQSLQQHYQENSQKKSSVPPSRFIRSTKSTAKVEKTENLDLDSLVKVLRNHR